MHNAEYLNFCFSGYLLCVHKIWHYFIEQQGLQSISQYVSVTTYTHLFKHQKPKVYQKFLFFIVINYGNIYVTY